MLLWNKGFKWHILQILIGVDQLVNAMLGGFVDETLSARCHRNADKGYWYAKVLRKLIDCIFGLLGQEDHCHQAYLSELNNRHLGKAYSTKN